MLEYRYSARAYSALQYVLQINAKRSCSAAQQWIVHFCLAITLLFKTREQKNDIQRSSRSLMAWIHIRFQERAGMMMLTCGHQPLHVGLYLLLNPSPYTNKDLQNYKSMDCYVNFVSGWVRELLVKQTGANRLVIAKVKQTTDVDSVCITSFHVG